MTSREAADVLGIRPGTAAPASPHPNPSLPDRPRTSSPWMSAPTTDSARPTRTTCASSCSPTAHWSPDEHGTDFDDAVHVIACQMHATQQNSVDRADHAGDDVS